ncbi:unnamed protein product [[Candida] boidinii]|nr:unnamed protein product [[Candida] boidinii]
MEEGAASECAIDTPTGVVVVVGGAEFKSDDPDPDPDPGTEPGFDPGIEPRIAADGVFEADEVLTAE